MEGKSNFFILLFIVAILTLTLAVLAGYLFFVAGSPKTVVEVTKKEATTRPSDDKLAVKKVFEGKKYFNLKAGADGKMAVIQVSAELVYFNKVSGIKEVTKKLEAYDGEIKELIGTYFQKLTLDEAKLPEAKEKAKKELKKEINELLLSTEKTKEEIIYTINFDEWFYQ